MKSNEMLKLKNVFKPPILNQIAVRGYQIKGNFKPVQIEVSEMMHTGRKIRYFDEKLDKSEILAEISEKVVKKHDFRKTRVSECSETHSEPAVRTGIKKSNCRHPQTAI